MELVAERERVEALFGLLVANRVDEFLAGCSDQLLLTVRGSGTLNTTGAPDRLSRWWEGLRRLAGETRGTEVLMTITEELSHVVILRHLFTRGGVGRKFDTVNFSTVRDGVLAAWFSSPLERQEYADAWGLSLPEDRRDRSIGRSARIADLAPSDLERS